jgi:hypothetical protein
MPVLAVFDPLNVFPTHYKVLDNDDIMAILRGLARPVAAVITISMDVVKRLIMQSAETNGDGVSNANRGIQDKLKLGA